MKPIAWYDPTNGMVSTDKDSSLFTPLGQVLPLYTKQEDDGITLTNIRHPRGKPALGDLNPESLETVEIDLPEPVAFINVEQRKLEWAKYMSWDTPTVVNLPKIPLYTTPPQRPWVGLTDEEVKDIVWNLPYEPSQEHIRAIEAKLEEKNT